jgi:RNA polymerase sigma factor (sigma-70 family)
VPDLGGLDQLVGLAIGGDGDALEGVLIRLHDPVLHYVRELGGSRLHGCCAEDVVQETFVEVFRRIGACESRGGAAFCGWVNAIARTRLSNLLRAQRAKKRGGHRAAITHITPGDADATAISILGLIASDDPTASMVLRRKEAVGALGEALAELDPLHQHVLQLRFAQGMSIEEVAIETGRSKGAIKMLIHRCVKELREKMDRRGEFTRGA